MKKTLGSIVLAGAIMSGITGCGGTAPQAQVKEEGDFRCRQDNVLAPEWTCNPYQEGAIVAIGIAKPNAGGDKSFQRTEAMGAGRDALARQMSVKVSNMLKTFKQSTGSGSDATFDASSKSVSKQLASQQINGSRGIQTWNHPTTKEMYILVGVSTESVKNALDSTIKNSYKNDKAMYQQFLAKKAGDELDAELEKAADK